MNDTFICRCGATVSRHNTLALTQHVMSEDHEAGLAKRGVGQHRHSERWVTQDGHPVEVGTEGARPYRTVNCVACVVDATEESEFVHDSELPSELCPYVDCDDHPSVSKAEVERYARENRREGRYRPCERCGHSPAIHNHNSPDSVGHDYA